MNDEECQHETRLMGVAIWPTYDYRHPVYNAKTYANDLGTQKASIGIGWCR